MILVVAVAPTDIRMIIVLYLVGASAGNGTISGAERCQRALRAVEIFCAAKNTTVYPFTSFTEIRFQPQGGDSYRHPLPSRRASPPQASNPSAGRHECQYTCRNWHE